MSRLALDSWLTTLHAGAGGILNASRIAVLCSLAVFLVVLIISAFDSSLRATARETVGAPGVMIMTLRPHESVAEGPLLLSAVKDAFRLSTALFARSAAHADARKRIAITAGIRN